ncbi:MAG: TRAP transporter small permease subunit [Betaproteobacteria bacterium]|nr:TRAP transporter small permease subunit [Betaproteobacteria bacterium]
MERLLAVSNLIDAVLTRIATAVGWLFLVLTAIVIFDVLTRKFGFQLPGMGSTRLQELEWHLHTAIFCFWLGMGYIRNSHVRIDIALTAASPRTKAWVEFVCCILFALPYCLLAIYFSADFTWISLVDNEGSPSANGLPWRWIPKSFIFFGLILLLLAVVSVLMRLVVYLYGPERLRERAAIPSIQSV